MDLTPSVVLIPFLYPQSNGQNAFTAVAPKSGDTAWELASWECAQPGLMEAASPIYSSNSKMASSTA